MINLQHFMQMFIPEFPVRTAVKKVPKVSEDINIGMYRKFFYSIPCRVLHTHKLDFSAFHIVWAKNLFLFGDDSTML